VLNIAYSIKENRAERALQREQDAQREADEHTFDLISRGQGGAL
jgi:hypothetical protein